MTIDISKLEEDTAPVPKEVVEGANAYSEDLPRDKNPYLTDTEAHKDWDWGWQESENHDEYINSEMSNHKIHKEEIRMREPSKKAVEAALGTIAPNDILYGDMSKPISEEEMRLALLAAYEVDDTKSKTQPDTSPTGYRHQYD